MKIRTVEELQDLLDKDLSWRRKELIEIKFLIDNSIGSTLQLNLKLGIVLLYAHWEGYIKNSANYYLIYLSRFSFKYNELTDNFVTLSLKGSFKKCAETDKLSIHYSIIDTLHNRSHLEIKIPTAEVIPKIGILNYELLYEILFTLGLEISPFTLKQHLINRDLVKNRNDIAHGEGVSIAKGDFYQLYDEMLPMMEQFRDEIYIAVKKRSYLKASV